nr:CRISPR-associated protein Csx16 [Conchiformibius kuhniae]
MTVWFVSRHEGALAWIEGQTQWRIDRFVPHLDVAQVAAGDVVLGTLPVHLAAQVCAKGAAFYFLQMPQQPEQRGSEYSAEEMTRAGACLRRFDVRLLEDGEKQ